MCVVKQAPSGAGCGDFCSVPRTVNTAPLETLDACRGHGEPKARLEQDAWECVGEIVLR